MRDYFQSPVNKSWVNFAGHPKGDAMDLGWRKGHSVNQDVFMMADGEVVWVGFLSDGGNSIVTKHDYNSKFDAWVGLMHFKNPTPHKVGAKLKRGTKVGNMGKTGVSKGEHVHVRISLVPKGSPFKWDTFDRFRVNPYDYVFEFSHQDVLDMKKKPSKPFIQPSGDNGKKYINIHKGKKYGTYAMNVVPVRKNISQWLRPDNLGGLSYEIQATTKDPNVFIIETRDFGKRQIFLDKSRASVTDKPLYKVYGKSSGSVQPKPVPKPKPKPSKVGKYANFGGNVRLFQKEVGDECYHSTRNGQKNVYTNVRNTSAKVLDEKNGRVLVSVPRFSPNRVWIANAESTISNSAKYKL